MPGTAAARAKEAVGEGRPAEQRGRKRRSTGCAAAPAGGGSLRVEGPLRR